MDTRTSTELLAALETAQAVANGERATAVTDHLRDCAECGADVTADPPVNVCETHAHPNDEVLCSFCGVSRAQCLGIIAGPCVYLCDGCFVLCADLFAEQLKLEGGGAHAVAQLQAARARAAIKAAAKDGQTP